MARTGPTLVGLFVTFLVILAVLQVVFPRREGFAPAPSNKKKSDRERCTDNSECQSNYCATRDSTNPSYGKICAQP